jgi:hypothetical protein
MFQYGILLAGQTGGRPAPLLQVEFFTMYRELKLESEAPFKNLRLDLQEWCWEESPNSLSSTTFAS